MVAPTMKVAIVYDMAYPWTKGGAEKRFVTIAEELARRGHDVHYFTMRHWGEGAAPEINGVRYHGVMRSVPAWDPHGKRRVAQALAFGAAIVPALGFKRFDVVDVCNFPFFSALSLSLVCRMRALPYCVTWLEYTGSHWDAYLGSFRGAVAARIEAALVSRSRNMVCISQHTLDRIASARRPIANAIVSTMGFELEHFRAAPVESKPTDLVYIGRLAPHKNIELALRAVQVIRETVDPAVAFEVIGTGPLRDRLAALASELGVARNTVFRGDVSEEEVYRCLQTARLLLHPSSREGLGVTVLEAKLCGVPAIVCRGEYNAAVSLVRHRETGFVCEPDPVEIARCYREALAGDLYSALSRNCLAERETYSIAAFVDKLEHFYRAIVRRPSSDAPVG